MKDYLEIFIIGGLVYVALDVFVFPLVRLVLRRKDDFWTSN